MMHSRDTYYAIFANIFLFTLSYVAYRQGYVTQALANDIAYITPAIGTVLMWGLVTVWFNPKYARWGVEACVTLGLLGTALGIWTAFSAVDPESIKDVDKIGQIVSVLLNGLGAALWTTICGAIAAAWLSVNLMLLTGDFE